jgi:mono/diheme cytochrome c family protein
MTLRLPAALFLLTLLIAPGLPAAAAGDAEEGGRIARRWCASCHMVDATRRGGDAAPPFVALANDAKKTETYLKNWIANPHPPMPNFNLSRRDVDDLVAYIATLTLGGGSRALPSR